MTDQQKEASYINLSSIVSSFAVVFIHSNGCFWTFSDTARYWWTANIIESVFYFAVPVFFMISGATLLDFFERYGLKEYFHKRVQKTVLPYVIWSFFGLAFQIYYLKNIDKEDINGRYIINGLLSGRLVDIYWFFMALFCLYLSIPLLAAVEKGLRKKVFVYLAISSFLFNCLIPFFNKSFHVDVGYQFSVDVGRGGILYLILGYLLHKCEIKRKVRGVLYATGILGLLIHLIGTYWLSVTAGEIVSTYKGYNNVPCIMYSVAVFLFLKHVWEDRLQQVRPVSSAIRFLKDYTFSLYIVHWYFLNIMVKEFEIDTRSIYYRLGAPFIVVAVTICFTWVMRKIPLGKKLLPR
nr:acyltransferase [uncultured Acetatifactor sp.]